VLFRSKTDEWESPDDIIALVNLEFSLELDVCASHENAKCARYFVRADDGLRQTWAGTCWMNPPYGKTIGLWVKKAFESSLSGATVICLLPARTDTIWWHGFVQPYAEVRFLKGRLKFGGLENSAPFASVIAIFRPPVA
jgi:phage N-6-adenine-methyltransferase